MYGNLLNLFSMPNSACKQIQYPCSANDTWCDPISARARKTATNSPYFEETNITKLDVRSLAIASRASQFPSGALSCMVKV